jgi:hypothetical protein
MKKIRDFIWWFTYGKKTYLFNLVCLGTLVFLFLTKSIEFWLLVLGSIYCGNKIVERMTK